MSVVEFDATTTVGAFTVTAEFTASPGITALFGPSGSGKSITLATIAGLVRPHLGTVVIDGRTVAEPAKRVHVPSQQRHLGMVFQHAALLAHRSPLDNVALGLNSSGRSTRRDRAGEWLARVHAEHLANAPTATLSGGEQQRVALARALIADPTLLLLDEPFSALDQQTRLSLRTLLRELVDQRGITAIVVTHDLDDITALADRVVLYQPGRTVGTYDARTEDRSQLVRLLGLAP